jgi:hypothetical protein
MRDLGEESRRCVRHDEAPAFAKATAGKPRPTRIDDTEAPRINDTEAPAFAKATAGKPRTPRIDDTE